MIHGIIVPDMIKDSCNQAAVGLGIDPSGMMTTLCIPLVPEDGTDDAIATHWAARGVINYAAREWLANNVASFPGAMWWRWDFDRILVASWSGENIGEEWGWSKCLESAGLKHQSIPIAFP